MSRTQELQELRPPINDASLEASLLEDMADPDRNLVERARACAMLVHDLGLAPVQIAERVGCSRSTIANLMRLPNLSEEVLELVARGDLGIRHCRALLKAKDPQIRRELARLAVREKWSVRVLEARAEGREVPSKQDLEAAAETVARDWGELLGVEVRVRPMAYGRVQLEVQFSSTDRARALADRLSATVVSRCSEANG